MQCLNAKDKFPAYYTIENKINNYGQHVNKRCDYQIKKYADKLKDIVCLLIGCTREQLEDREFKEKELGEEWDRYIFGKSLVSKSEIIQAYKDEWGSDPSDYWLNSQKITMTVRKLIQLLGTECGRNIIHPNIWVNALFADYNVDSYVTKQDIKDFDLEEEKYNLRSSWIITDVRFENEAQAIKDRGGIVIRVNRPFKRGTIVRFKHESRFSSCLAATSGTILSYNSRSGKYKVDTVHGIAEISKNVVYILNQHSSETSLDEYEFDHVIDNSGSIEELVEKVKQLNLV